MVGVPWSKGCALCLQRSVKCDAARPSCSQCRRGGRTCPGYQRAAKFVDEGSKLRCPTKSTKKRLSSRQSVSNTDNRRTSKVTNGRRESTEPFNSSGYGNRCTTAPYYFNSSVQHRVQLVASFVSNMFPLGIASVQRSFVGSWLWHVPTHFGQNTVLDCAALSLALAHFGQRSKDQFTIRNAELSYNVALRTLAAAVSDERKRFSADILCATMLLGSYEAFFHRGHNYICHAGGAARLMQLRGARSCYDSAFEYSMYLACRGTIISESLIQGKPCFLQTEKWRAIPEGLIEFPLLPKSPELLHAFFGYIAAIPGLLHDVKLVKNGSLKSHGPSIFSRAQTLRRDPRQWHQLYIKRDSGLRMPILLEIPTGQNFGIFDFAYVYSDVIAACVLTTYCAYLIVVNRLINCLATDISCSEENFALAREICLSVNYCLNAGHCGSQTLMFSLPIARTALSGEYLVWCEAWLKKISGNGEEPVFHALDF